MKMWTVLILVAGVVELRANTPDLMGRVLREDNSPLQNATVFIYTAGPKSGTGAICPSCYPDCRKKARTDSEGRFKIESLNPKLLFRLLVVAGGFEPNFVTKVDPTKGPREIIMNAIDKEDEADRAKITGMVIGPDGAPVFGAVLNVEGVERGSGTRWGGVDRDSDPVAVSDENGLFTLRCSQGLTSVHALAESPGLAKRWVRLAPGTDHLLRMQDGVIVRGQVLSKGKPVENGLVGLVTVQREAGKSMHDFEGVTDENGRFTIMNVTPEKEYYLFGKMESMGNAGALAVKRLKAGATDSTVDLGKVELAESHRISGRVVLADDKSIPPETRLFLGRDEAWDHTETVLGPDGRFEFVGVPSEAVSLSVRVRGYKFSHKNPSLDWYNGGIIGKVERDLKDFIILLEPGEWRLNREEEDAPPGTDRQPRGLPLRSAEL